MATHDGPAPDGGAPAAPHGAGSSLPDGPTAVLAPEEPAGETDTPRIPRQDSPADSRKSHGSRRKPKSGIKRFIKPIAIGSGVSLIIATGSGWLYYQHLNHNIKTSPKNLTDVKGQRTAPNAAGQSPLNILLLGSDSRASAANVALGGGKNDRTRAALADVQMLLHVSADRSNASLVSIPRDTMIDIPPCRTEDGKQSWPDTPYSRINAALSHGGPGCVLGTWTKLTGLEIDHFLMVDFAGVVTMADAVGGVPVCVDMNFYDRKTKLGGTGLKLPKGTTVLNSQQSLMWLRARDAWGSDINRTRAQHMYLSSLIRTLKGKGTLTNPSALRKLAEAATKAVQPDDGLNTIKKLYDLGTQLRKVPTNRITTLTIPVLPDPRNPKATVVPSPDADRIWQMLLSDVPLDRNGIKKKKKATQTTAPAAPVDRAAVRVSVSNSTGIAHRASAVATALGGAGFTKAAVGNPGNVPAQPTTTLTFGPAAKAEAQALAIVLKLPSTALKQSANAGDPVLVIGTDWTTGTLFPFKPTPKAGAVPTSASAKNAADKDCMHVVPQGGIYTY
jgi:LCP family protein required for cell wall assembly